MAALTALIASRVDGQVTPRVGSRVDTLVTAVEDTTQHYALFLPPSYDASRRWPILFVLDPRGRARLALDLFRPAAERLGYIVMSSYNSLSDSPDRDVNLRAMNAMLASAQERLSIDARRLYIAGFSGTARAAVGFAVELRGRVAGVIGAGAAVGFGPGSIELTFANDSTFAYFAATGTDDFNYEEVRAMAERLRTMKVPHRLAVFAGPHSWPPVDVCGDALEWFALRAMRGGLARADSVWIATHLDDEMALATSLEQAGRLDDALRLYEAIARDYPDAPAVSTARTRAASLAEREPMRRLVARARKLTERDEQNARELQVALAWIRQEKNAPSAGDIAKRLSISSLKAQAERGDSLEAPSARRLLARTNAFVSFYEPRSYITSGNLDKAARMLEVAASIAPLRGEACNMLRDLRQRAPKLVGGSLSTQCMN